MSPVVSNARRRAFSLVAAIALAAALLPGSVLAQSAETKRYLVVFGGEYALDGSYALGGNYALNHGAALAAVEAAGGTVANDLSKQIGVMVVDSANAQFLALIKGYALVEEAGEDLSWQGVPTADGASAPEPQDDPLEAAQWDMQMINTDAAHDVQGGRPEVQVGVLDTGIDGHHVDFRRGLASNVNCALGRNSITFLPGGPGVGNPDPCVDNQVHGTHVAGTIAARANGVGIVGIAPNVTLIPVKVCDSTGYCYASAVVDGVTYAGDQQFEVINMSFFVDDNEFQQSTEFKCMDDPAQRAFRKAVERAMQYARNQGVTPVAALGNSDEDLAHPSEPNENNCDVVPAETEGVVGTVSLGRQSEKAGYSNYGTGAADVSAPGGNSPITGSDCNTQILSTVPIGTGYACLQGTSMASPHAAGVAALIVSQFGSLGGDGDWKMSPTKVEDYLQSTTVDIGLPGYDECFGNGRIDAFRAVTHDTSGADDPAAPFCPEYAE
jgi:subtilisin family serine protease